ncbi:MAG: Hsp20/alpha crystallin family protein [Candidatus Omnitrophica bacterium]|nr:Hsp20/alpha crystallin family protein [Candidatus Omnitrophota bacterium]
MKLVKWSHSPWRTLEDIQDEINRLFDFSYDRDLAERAGITAPLVDISEDKDNVYVEADLPGLEQKDISVNLRKNSLFISGKKEEVKEEKNKNYHRSERVSRSFYRQILLPALVDQSKVKANYKQGVLKLVLPKKEEAKEKDIKIEVE